MVMRTMIKVEVVTYDMQGRIKFRIPPPPKKDLKCGEGKQM